MRKFILFPFLLFTFACAYNLTIPESELNARLQKVFPVEREVYLSKVKLEDPKLKLLGNNRGEVILDFSVEPPIGPEIKGKVDAVGKFQYDPKSRTIYLTDLETKELDVNGRKFLSEKTGRIISSLFRTVLKRIPVYRFEGEKARLIKGITVEKGKVVVKLGV